MRHEQTPGDVKARFYLYLVAEDAGDGDVSFWHTVVPALSEDDAYAVGMAAYEACEDAAGGEWANDYVIALVDLGLTCGRCEACVRRG